MYRSLRKKVIHKKEEKNLEKSTLLDLFCEKLKFVQYLLILFQISGYLDFKSALLLVVALTKKMWCGIEVREEKKRQNL